jgi:hypothetical protein
MKQKPGGYIFNEEFHGLHCSPNNIRVTKSRRMEWVEHVECMGEKAN